MALIFIGSSECPLCNKIFVQEDEIIGLPAIVNTEHPLYEYFDSGIHKTCFESWNKKDEILNILNEENKSI